MPKLKPDRALQRRRLAATVALLGATCSAMAAPDPRDAVNLRSQHVPSSVIASFDPVLRLLVEKGLVAESSARDTRSPQTAVLQPVDGRFVDRFRDSASGMVLTAMNFLGVPYQRGGADADHGFDCSGFTRHVFATSLGLVLPRRADEQATTAGLLAVGRTELKPGDLVFFNTMRRNFSHVGIYVGAGRFIHSPKPGGEVRVDDLQASYWDKRFTGGRRAGPFVPVGQTGAKPPTVN